MKVPRTAHARDSERRIDERASEHRQKDVPGGGSDHGGEGAGDQPGRAPPVADDEAGDIARTNSVHISICTVRQEAVAVPSSEEHQDRRRSGAADVARGPEGQEDAGRRRTCARPQPRGTARSNTERSSRRGSGKISAGPVTFPGRTAAVLTGRPGSAGRGMWNCGVTHRVPLLRFAVTGGARVARGGGVSVATSPGG